MKQIAKYARMSAEELLEYEAALHDELRAFDPAAFSPKPVDLQRFWQMYDRPWRRGVYIEGWTIRRAVEMMGDLSGKRLLDVGCGPATHSAIYALLGAEVWGFDISPVSIEKARLVAEANGVADRCHFQVASAGDIPMEDESFDVVACISVLHHIWKYPRVPDELYRVVATDGVLVFRDGLRSNPLYTGIRNVKRWLTREEPDGDIDFEYGDLMDFAARFQRQHIEYYYLLMSVKTLFRKRGNLSLPVRWLFYLLDRTDAAIFKCCPFLHRFSHEVVGVLHKGGA